jgi:hypothetical protein
MSEFSATRTSDIHVIQEQSRRELERMLSLKKLVGQDLNPASFALSRFFYFAGFSTLQYGEAWKKSLPKKVPVGKSASLERELQPKLILKGLVQNQNLPR